MNADPGTANASGWLDLRCPERTDDGPAPAQGGRAARLRAALRDTWSRFWMDDRTHYLSQAISHADLERRMRAWDALDRWALQRLPPTA